MKVSGFAMIRQLLSPVLMTIFASAALAQSGAELLKAVGARYGTLETFHFEALEVTRTSSGAFERTTKNRVVTALDPRGRSRVEFDDGSTGGITVSNGDTTWVYFPHLKKYSKFSGMPLEGAGEGSQARGLDFSGIAQRYTSRYRGVSDSLIAAKSVNGETIEVGGRPFQCQVVEAQYRPPPGVADGSITRTYWIDSESKLVLRERSVASMKPPKLDAPVVVRQVIEFRHARAGGTLPDDLFVFQPPPGVEEVGSAEFQKPPSSNLDGRPAPDFQLQELSGRKVALKELRGHVVVLDFWATWCGPCRIDMPRIEALHNELKDQGLQVFGVNGEDAALARSYLQRNSYTFPTLSDPGMQVAQLYEVNALPTAVVIDKEGKIAAYLQGSGTKERLLEAIRAAGLR
jgi:peroxiredoxin/outer membrane lipoprotein-sorting protein